MRATATKNASASASNTRRALIGRAGPAGSASSRRKPLLIVVPRDAERARHDLADHAGHVLAVLVLGHPIRRLGVVDDEVDHRTGRLEIGLVGVADADAELFFDRREEFIERPAHLGRPPANDVMMTDNVVVAV
jgi:hypothetical protein